MEGKYEPKYTENPTGRHMASIDQLLLYIRIRSNNPGFGIWG